VVDTHLDSTEIPYRVLTEVRHPAAAAAIDDDLAPRIETCRTEDLLDAIGCDEILSIVVAQDARRIADVDCAGNMSRRIGFGGRTSQMMAFRAIALATYPSSAIIGGAA
jgi:hypothetical protein